MRKARSVKAPGDVLFELNYNLGASQKSWERHEFGSPRRFTPKLILLWVRGIINNPYDSYWVDIKYRARALYNV